ncbi:substrate-binding domain-containing protein [Microbacterium xanthum]|uniref:substrate-binding domain-containing protein n=1 Tax=Microbacterium xanthum TaxID=3079794 RepID=UPI002AD59145|nr:substrate-binding domain-containing protein [Microbacterium sp. KSW-48]MDZ8173010.1 substrate-binding domain-containing protein [Microbacterium sp. KSW-48]
MAGHSPLPRTRHELILRHIELRGSVNAAAVAEELNVSQVTIRRDIAELEAQGRLVRVHGGAIPPGAPAAPQAARLNIGVVVPSTVGHFPVIVRGMDAASHARRARVVLATSRYRAAIENQQVERLLHAGVDGLIVAPTMRERSEEDLAAWATRLPVPVVFLERRLQSTSLAAFDSARSDHARGAALAVEHFAGLGHRAVGLATFARTPTAPLVMEGYTRAVERLGLAPAPYRALPQAHEDDDGRLDIELSGFLDDCLAAGVRAALVHSDVHAARMLEVAADRGIRVPDDVAIIAYDDDIASMAMVPMTAVTSPRRDLGYEVMRIVTERISERASQAARSAPRNVTMLPQLTIRRSCGAST